MGTQEQNSNRLDKAKVLQELKECKVGLFAERANTTEALEYAQSLVALDNRAAVTIAIMVYHNTLLQCIIESIQDEVEQKTTA